MVALKVTMPHLPSLSRHSSPSRPSTPLAEEPTTSNERTSSSRLGAALRRSTSGRIPVSSVPSTTTSITTAHPSPPSSRPPSDSTTLKPLRSVLNSAVSSATANRRAQSSDRRTFPTAAQPSLATTTLQQSSSQPPLSRHSTGATGSSATTNGTGKRSPVLSASGAGTPTLGGRGTPTLHNLEESYVGKVSLRLGEAVNKVFLADPKGGASEVSFKGRAVPKVDRTKEVGDMVVHELQAALHDVYLLRTLLRSSVLKSLSLFLTRLTALLLPSDAVGPPPFTLKEADSLSPALRFNLQIVRCAFELKRSLELAARGCPSFVKDTLKPWTDKLHEVMHRVMNPLILSVRIAVSLICDKARIPETAAEATAFALAHPQPGGGSTAALKQGGAQLRSLSSSMSMSRAQTPTPGVGGLASGASTPVALQQGPAWLRELTAVLDATVRMISRLECGAEADKWLVSVGTHAVWKGMLSLSARRIPISDDLARPGSSHSSDAQATATTPSASSHKTPFFSTKTKRSPSPGDSPPLHPVGHPSHGILASPSEVAFLRLLSELELLEARLVAFSSALSSISPAVSEHVLMSGTCADITRCGLCKTGRQFDAESSDDEDDEEPMGGLAQYAMREAMQALSAMVVVVRASKRCEVLKEALIHGEDEREEQRKDELERQQKAGAGKIEDTNSNNIVPLTPMALINGVVPSAVPSPTATPAAPVTPIVAPSPLICPTLSHALDTLPTLILLHLLASRLPSSYFKLPHELWGIDWRSYEKEIRGFASGEEWTGEVAWEMAGEVSRCIEGREVGEGKERERMECLVEAIQRKAGVDVQGI